jgi:hypothetical protein
LLRQRPPAKADCAAGQQKQRLPVEKRLRPIRPQLIQLGVKQVEAVGIARTTCRTCG